MSVSLIDGHIDRNEQKMTDNEIIKALKGCGCTTDCKWCPYYDSKKEHEEKCYIRRNKDFNTLMRCKDEQIEALIAGQETLQKALNEKIAEIERLGKEHCEWKSAAITNAQAMFTIKTKAVKEFAERLKEKIDCDIHTSLGFYFVASNVIDNLVKEMVGDFE